MTAFENYFDALKKVLGNPNLYEIWPDFEPVCDESEYSWTTLRGLGEVLLLNCGECDGPSDLKHPRCDTCTKKRANIALESYTRATGKEKKSWTTIMLCRIHSPD